MFGLTLCYSYVGSSNEKKQVLNVKNENAFTPLCVACKYKRIFGVLEFLKMRKMDPDILACNYVRIYLHASLTYFPNDF